MYCSTFKYRVRYADVDQMSYMYYGNYARLFEIGRVEALRNLGVSYKQIEEMGIWMPVYENYSKYIAPAKYDDELEIKTCIANIPKTRMEFDYEIFESERKIHQGKTTLVFLDAGTQKLITCPTTIKNLLKTYFES